MRTATRYVVLANTGGVAAVLSFIGPAMGQGACWKLAIIPLAGFVAGIFVGSLAILGQLTVRQALATRPDTQPVLVTRQTSFHQLRELFANSTQFCFPVVDDENKLTGMIDEGDIRRIVTETGVDNLIIARDIEMPAKTATREDSLLSGLNNMVESNKQELVVVHEDNNVARRPLSSNFRVVPKNSTGEHAQPYSQAIHQERKSDIRGAPLLQCAGARGRTRNDHRSERGYTYR